MDMPEIVTCSLFTYFLKSGGGIPIKTELINCVLEITFVIFQLEKKCANTKQPWFPPKVSRESSRCLVLICGPFSHLYPSYLCRMHLWLSTLTRHWWESTWGHYWSGSWRQINLALSPTKTWVSCGMEEGWDSKRGGAGAIFLGFSSLPGFQDSQLEHKELCLVVLGCLLWERSPLD